MNGRHRKAVPSSIVDGAVPDGRALAARWQSIPLLAGATSGWRWRSSAAFAVLATDAGAQIVAGPNANVGGGPACKPESTSFTDCPFQVFGDVTIRRQTKGRWRAGAPRNPQTCMAAGNDYRLVGLPGLRRPRRQQQGHRGCLARNFLVAQRWPGLGSILLPGWKTDEASGQRHDTRAASRR